ncbi:V-type ATPase subunit [Candidatus Desantisbacteria bacterium]|nr:V-type ATPase subunit [Candidatus Desantisbacteria bacterium]
MFLSSRKLHKEDIRYGYATGRIRMLENKLIDRVVFERMIEAETPGAVTQLIENKYGHLSLNSENLKICSDFESILGNEFYKFYCIIEELACDKDIVDLFFSRYMFHNIKVLIKSKYLGEEAMEMIYFNVGPIHFPGLRDIVLNSHKDHPVTYIKEKVEAKFIQSGNNPQIIDIMLDQEYFEWIKNLAKKINLPVIDELIKIWIDLANIKNLFRMIWLDKELELLKEITFTGGNIEKEQYIDFYISKNWTRLNDIFKYTPYKALIQKGIESLKTESLSDLERSIDVYTIKWLMDSKYIVFGVEPLLYFILCKEYEIRLLRIILLSKIYNITPEMIRRQIGEIL